MNLVLPMFALDWYEKTNTTHSTRFADSSCGAGEAWQDEGGSRRVLEDDEEIQVECPKTGGVKRRVGPQLTVAASSRDNCPTPQIPQGVFRSLARALYEGVKPPPVGGDPHKASRR